MLKRLSLISRVYSFILSRLSKTCTTMPEVSPKKIARLEIAAAMPVMPMPMPMDGLDGINPSTRPVLKFAKLTENAFVPTRGSKLAAGYDLYSAYDYDIPALGKALVKTDIQIALPNGCYGRVAPRSGLAHKHFIDVGAGVIDQDYRGNVGVILFNLNKDSSFKVNKGDRVAQLILERIYLAELQEFSTLDETSRGEGGFGSTGTN